MNKLIVKSDIFSEFSFIDHLFGTGLNGTFENTIKNIRKDLNLKNDSVLWSKQVHGDNILRIKRDSVYENVKYAEADALITDVMGTMVGIKTADCCPILIADIKKKAVGAVHAGWKGTNLKILEKTILKMKEKFKIKPENLKIAIGPCIGKCCYSVDKERYEAMKKKLSYIENYSEYKEGRFLISISELNRRIAVETGVEDESIDIISKCTCCEEDFFSYRREGVSSGRQYSGIMLKEG